MSNKRFPFTKQHDFRINGQRPGNCNQLLLPAGNLFSNSAKPTLSSRPLATPVVLALFIYVCSYVFSSSNSRQNYLGFRQPTASLLPERCKDEHSTSEYPQSSSSRHNCAAVKICLCRYGFGE